MSSTTLVTLGPVPGTFVPPFQGTTAFKDNAGILPQTRVFVSYDNGGANILRFDDWGNSTSIIDSWTPSGMGPGGLPTKFTIVFHGIGNLDGQASDDPYNGTMILDLGYSFNEGTHRYEVAFRDGTCSLTYTL